mgnify:CR=1 FL=1
MKQLFTLGFFLFLFTFAAAQDDLLSLVEEDAPEREPVTATFKTNRVINFSSTENTAAGVLDFKISHRFGFLNGGFYELFGLDNATIRLGLDYGITDRLMIGVGRSSYQKTYDGYFKYKILRQSTGAKAMPVTLSVFAGSAIQTLKWPDPDRDNKFSSRLYYNFQVILGRKFSDGFSLQLSPTLVHRNLVATRDEANDVFALGIGGRIKLNRRVSINAEYAYIPDGQLAAEFKAPISLGFDIETGGHVFQLHFTNATSMIENGFIGETIGNVLDGDIHFGFNISRVFTLAKPK